MQQKREFPFGQAQQRIQRGIFPLVIARRVDGALDVHQPEHREVGPQFGFRQPIHFRATGQHARGTDVSGPVHFDVRFQGEQTYFSPPLAQTLFHNVQRITLAVRLIQQALQLNKCRQNLFQLATLH